MVERIADLVKEKKIKGIADIRDESNREGMRVVIVLKKDAQPKAVLTSFTNTQRCRRHLMLILLH